MKQEVFDIDDADIAWCPGCGNFSILSNLKKVFADLEIDPRKFGTRVRNRSGR